MGNWWNPYDSRWISLNFCRHPSRLRLNHFWLERGHLELWIRSDWNRNLVSSIHSLGFHEPACLLHQWRELENRWLHHLPSSRLLLHSLVPLLSHYLIKQMVDASQVMHYTRFVESLSDKTRLFSSEISDSIVMYLSPFITTPDMQTNAASRELKSKEPKPPRKGRLVSSLYTVWSPWSPYHTLCWSPRQKWQAKYCSAK